MRALLLELLGTMSDGESLPAERDLAERWNVSRMTLRHVWSEELFVVEGVIARRAEAGASTSRVRGSAGGWP